MHISAYLSGAAIAGLSAIAVKYRPIPDFGPDHRPGVVTLYRSMDLKKEPASLLICRSITMFTGALGSKFLMHALNELEIIQNQHYHNWLKNIRDRSCGTPLITVANHGVEDDDF